MSSTPRLRPLTSFLRTEAGGAVVLLAATLTALVWANIAGAYGDLWHRQLGPLDLRHWVNDGLMSLFFLVVGLEIKRELVEGELRDPRVALLPVLATLAGLQRSAALGSGQPFRHEAPRRGSDLVLGGANRSGKSADSYPGSRRTVLVQSVPEV